MLDLIILLVLGIFGVLMIWREFHIEETEIDDGIFLHEDEN